MKLLLLLLVIPFLSYGQNPQGNALHFDGANDYVLTPSNSLLTNVSFSIEAWIKRTAIGGSDWFLTQGANGASTGLHFGFRPTNQFSFAFYSNDLDSPIYTDTDWHHWAATYNATTNARNLYRDGVLVASDVASSDFLGSGPFNFGRQYTGAVYTGGQLNELRIWNDVRTLTEIQNNRDIVIDPASAGLIAYYTFDQGDAGNNNTGLTNEVIDYVACGKGTLTNFALTGATSNWVSTTNDEAPILTTTSIGEPTEVTTITGNIFSIGASSVTTRGFCYSTSDCPTITDNLVNESGTYSTGTYSLKITSGLTHGTIHYVRAYATNTEGTSYGETMSFIPLKTNTGPGGVGVSDGSSTLELWLDANVGTSTTTDGANLTQWDDQSGNSIDVAQGTAGNQPSFENDGTNAINGFPVIHFDGNDVLQSATTSLNVNNDFTVFLIKEDNTTQPTPNSYYLSVSGTDPGIGVYRGDGGNDKFIAKASGAYTSDWILTGGVTNNAPYIGEYKRTGTTMYLSRFGNAYITDAGTVGPVEFGTGSTVRVGSNPATSYLQGNVAEEIVFSKAVNTAEKIIIENYLAAKYGISLGTNDVYDQDNPGNGNYDFEVAGIGRVDASNIHNDSQGTGKVRIFNPTGLGDNEFLFWGHDNGTSSADETTDVPVGVDARLTRVWRVSETNAAGSAVDVGSIDIRFDLTGLGDVTVADLRLLVDTDNDGLFSDETPISGASAMGANIVEFAGVSAIVDNSRFSLGTIDIAQTVLPTELVEFNVENINDESVSLKWKTVSERNNDYFMIERSLDIENWGEIDKLQGVGTTNAEQSYHSIDFNPLPGTNYYRVKQIDFDGKFTYTDVKSVYINALANNSLSIYPNPSRNMVVIEGIEDELSTVKIYNMLGQDVSEHITFIKSRDTRLTLDLTDLKSGAYLVKTRTLFGTLNKY